jgi:hypothetical protein
MNRIDFKGWWYRSMRGYYRGQRPNWIARMLNRGWAAVGSSSVASNYLVALETTGRTSGRTISQPMVMAVVDGEHYLVSMLGENVNWVKNVRAAGGKAALRSGTRKELRLEEVAVSQRAPILKAYLQRAPGARPHVPVDKDAHLSEFEKVAAAFPVFRVVSKEPIRQRTCCAIARHGRSQGRCMLPLTGIVRPSVPSSERRLAHKHVQRVTGCRLEHNLSEYQRLSYGGKKTKPCHPGWRATALRTVPRVQSASFRASVIGCSTTNRRR